MPGLVSQIRWGTGEENVLTFEYPFDNQRFYRKRRPSSSRIRVPGEGYDTWKGGKDFLMEADVRWLSLAKYSDPVGVEAFLDYAGDDGTFSFVPDSSVPDFAIPSCYLEAPYESPDPGREQSGEQIVRLVIGNPLYNFAQALRGIMFEYVPGASLIDPVAAAFTRATGATRRGLPGSLLTAIGASELSNVLRDRHYEGTRRAALLEGLRVQLVTDPEDFSTWSTTGSITRTGGQPDPFGGTGAYLLTSNTVGANNDGIHRAVTFTADGTKAILCFMRAGTSALSQFRIRDATAGVNRHVLNVTWTAGVPSLATSAGAGTIFSIIPYGDGWYALAAAVNSVVVAATTNDYQFHPDPVTGGGTVYLFRANAWNCTYPTSSQGPTLTTKNADNLAYPIPGLRAQPLAVLLTLMERGFRLGVGTGAGNTVAMQLGSLSGGNPRLTIEGGSGNYSGSHFSAVGQVGSSRAAGVEGDVVELLLLLRSDGSVQLIRSLNFGADSIGTQSGAHVFPSSWGANPGIMLGSILGGNTGLVPLLGCKVMPLIYAGVTRDSTATARVA